jgi:hypothetical protein
MERADDLVVKNADGEVVVEVTPWQVARALQTPLQIAEVLSRTLNLGAKQFVSGRLVGRLLRSDHRTLQRQAIGFCLGVIVGLSDQQYTDPRNSTAIETAKKISRMVDDGELPLGSYL